MLPSSGYPHLCYPNFCNLSFLSLTSIILICITSIYVTLICLSLICLALTCVTSNLCYILFVLPSCVSPFIVFSLCYPYMVKLMFNPHFCSSLICLTLFVLPSVMLTQWSLLYLCIPALVTSFVLPKYVLPLLVVSSHVLLLFVSPSSGYPHLCYPRSCYSLAVFSSFLLCFWDFLLLMLQKAEHNNVGHTLYLHIRHRHHSYCAPNLPF